MEGLQAMQWLTADRIFSPALVTWIINMSVALCYFTTVYWTVVDSNDKVSPLFSMTLHDYA